MSRALVTGAAGFIGLNCVQRLAALGHEVIGLTREAPDAATEAFLGEHAGQVRFVQGDVRDRDGLADLIRRERVTRVLHAAAVTSAEIERAEPALFMDINLGGALNVLEAARQHGLARVVLVSSSALYGAPDGAVAPIDEHQPLRTSSLYTLCKFSGEQLCQRYQTLFEISAVAGRVGSAYGPMERPTPARQTLSQVTTLLLAGHAGTPLRIAGATRLRDVCHVADVAAGLVALLLAERLSHPVYNIAANAAYPLDTIAAAVAAFAPQLSWRAVPDGSEAEITVGPASARGPLDVSRLADELGVAPRYGLEDGLRAYDAWLRAQQRS